MSTRNKAVAALLAALALFASACGGDPAAGDGSTTPTTAVVDDETAAVLPGEGVEVIAARANWSTGYMQGAIYAALLEELGYTVSDPAANEIGPADAYLAMANGEIDFWANSWYPSHDGFLEVELDDGTAVGDHLLILGQQMPNAALEGILITRSVAEERGITSLAQINGDPELVELFDLDGNGRADVLGCPESWSCDDIIDATIERNGWTNLEQIQDDYDTMVASAVERVAAGQPVLLYTWSPSGYLAELVPGENVMWISVGGEEYVCDGTAPCEEGWRFAAAGPAPLGEQCTDDPCWLGWQSASIHVTANAGFAAANPTAARLFELVEIAVIDVVNFSVRYSNGASSEDDVKAMADEWISANRAKVDLWLSRAGDAA